jgi:hypothetical protein
MTPQLHTSTSGPAYSLPLITCSHRKISNYIFYHGDKFPVDLPDTCGTAWYNRCQGSGLHSSASTMTPQLHTSTSGPAYSLPLITCARLRQTLCDATSRRVAAYPLQTLHTVLCYCETRSRTLVI